MQELGVGERDGADAKHARVDDPFPDRLRDGVSNEGHPNKVSDCGESDRFRGREDFGGDDGGDCVRGVVKSIEEIEREDNEDCHHNEFYKHNPASSSEHQHQPATLRGREQSAAVPIGPARFSMNETGALLLILRDDIAQDVCDILAVVGGLLEPLDDLFELDDVHGIRVLEKVRHRIVHQIVRSVL